MKTYHKYIPELFFRLLVYGELRPNTKAICSLENENKANWFSLFRKMQFQKFCNETD